MKPLSSIRWHPGEIAREKRWQALSTSGATVWLTGLSGSGKSTIGAAVERRLIESGRPAYLLDGDNLRHGLNADLGFSDEHRKENVRRVAEVARLCADAGLVAIVALISPFRSGRELAREIHTASGLPYFEVWVDTPLEVCERRDPKGLYARARAGELREFSGITSPYEPPRVPDLILRADEETIGSAAEKVLSLISHAGGGHLLRR